MALSTTTTTPTGWAADARYQNYLAAQQIAGKPHTPYTGNMLAGPNPNQMAGYAQLANGQNFGGAAMQSATNAAQNAANFQGVGVSAPSYAPTMQGVMNTGAASAGPATSWNVTNTAAASAGNAAHMTAAQAQLAQMQAAQMSRGSVRDVTAKNFLNYDINKYLNPHTNTVVNNALGDLSRQNAIVNNTTNARAQAAGAFGGSRQAVANNLNNESYLRESGNLSGTLRQQGYDTAAGLIMKDADRDLSGQQSNQAMDFNVGSLNTNMRQQAGLQNMLASNNMSQYNASNRQNASQWNAGATNQQNQYNAGLTQRANEATSNAHNAAATQQAMNANQMAQYNAGLVQRAHEATSNAHNVALANQANATNRAGEFNADLNLRAQGLNQAASQNAINSSLTAANYLNGFGLDQQRWNTNNASGQLTAGNAMQQQEQARLNDVYARWQQEQDHARNQLNYLNNSLGNYSTGTAQNSPYYANTAANALAGGIGGAQLAGMLPSAIGGLSSGYNALSGMFGSGGLTENVGSYIADNSDLAFDLGGGLPW